MGTEFRQTTEADIDSLRDFLKSAFRAGNDEPLVNPAQMRWKFYEPRPDWLGSRSYVLTKDGLIVAHCSILPVTFLAPRGRITSLNPLDWGATEVGAGVQLLRKLHALSDTVLGFDAAEVTYDLLKKLQYRAIGQLRLFVRVIRPIPIFRSGRRRAMVRATLCLLRNQLDRMRPTHTPGREWSFERVLKFDDSFQPILPRPSANFSPSQRSPELLNYMLRCPVAELSGFALYREARVRGYFLLSRIGSQARIIDLHVDSENPIDWHAGFSLATRAAAADPRVCEVMASATVAFVQNAIEANGYRQFSSGPIFMFDPKNVFAGIPPPSLNLIDDDMAYL